MFFVHPQPEAPTLSKAYESAYYDSPSDYSADSMAVWEERMSAIETVCEPGVVLDVGCGRGHFMMSAMRRGWDAWGLEIAVGAVKELPESLRARVTVGELESAPFKRGTFDLLTYFDVIEHVREPVEFLRHGHDLLRPAGHLVITTPNAATLKARLKGRYWKYFDFRRYLHLYHFTPHTLELALQQAGFEVATWLRRQGMPLWVVTRKVERGRSRAARRR
ncbi:MAG: hypothetical protein AMS21_08295 [Gemmatimonas sp. SG8_38_2]|nr:MAG: hypothetical protein AMS21_08295 [Gemmatimonas sp. SG8_38_2]